MRRKIVFESSAFADFNDWIKQDKKIHRKIVELVKDIDRNPFQGLGKPEVLKHDLSGARISDSPVVVRRRSARTRCVEKNRSRTSLSL